MEENVPQILPKGHRLEGYEIRDTLGAGKFGNVYLCTGPRGEGAVAVREYLPRGLAARGSDGTVRPQSAAAAAAFENGRSRFMARAERMARVDHLNLVRIHRVFVANGTTYVTMDHADGQPLASMLEGSGTLPPERLAACLLPVMDAIASMHAAGVAHGNIGPGSVVVRDDGTPLLLGLAVPPSDEFGTVAKPGYAPIEHYSSADDLGGARADIYSLGAVIYRCMTGVTPPEAPVRAERDTLIPASRAGRGRYGPRLLAVIDQALRLQPDERPERIEALRDALATGVAADASASRASLSLRTWSTGIRRHAVPAAAGVGIVAVLAGMILWGPGSPDPAPDAAPPLHTVPESPDPASVEPSVVGAGAGAEESTPAGNGAARPAPDAAPPLHTIPESPEPASVEPSVAGAGADESTPADTAAAGAAPGTPWATLFVGSTPSGALVAVDGQAVGETPVQLDELEPGTVRLSLDHPYFEALELDGVELAVGEVTRIERELVRATGGLRVSSVPADAWIEVDGSAAVARTPATLADLPSGLARVVVGADGYLPAAREVVVPKDATGEFAVELEREFGSLTLTLTPPDAQATLPDAGLSYEAGMRLPAGSHRLTVVRQGFETADRVVEVSGDTAVPIALEPVPQPLTVVATPPGARIFFANVDEPYSPGLPMPPGDYDVRAELLGYRSWTGTIRHGTAPTEHAITLAFVSAEYADALRIGGTGPQMIVVPAGSFRMGCLAENGCAAPETPVRVVNIATPFSISKHEVTFAQYDRFARAAGRRRPDDAGWGRGDRPVVNVSWGDAVEYVEWLSAETGRRYALPGEAEWEYAARAGTETRYAWGDAVGDQANCADCSRSPGRSVTVGSFRANAWGLHDMHGNVWEWVQDCWNASYENAPTDAGARSDGDCGRRMLRGGSWFNAQQFARSASRLSGEATVRGNIAGFRVVARDR